MQLINFALNNYFIINEFKKHLENLHKNSNVYITVASKSSKIRIENYNRTNNNNITILKFNIISYNIFIY